MGRGSRPIGRTSREPGGPRGLGLSTPALLPVGFARGALVAWRSTTNVARAPLAPSTADGRAMGGRTSRDPGLFGVAASLTVIDAVATLARLQIGIADEGNPVLVGYIDMFGGDVAIVGRAFWGLVLLVGLLVLASYTRVRSKACPSWSSPWAWSARWTSGDCCTISDRSVATIGPRGGTW